MRKLLLALPLLAWGALGAAHYVGCNAPGVVFDLYAPRPYPDQPVMRYYTIHLDGEPYGYVLYQGHFAVGLHPSQNVKLCWADNYHATTRDPDLCPAEVPPVETPCLTGYDDTIGPECFAPAWFAFHPDEAPGTYGTRGGQNENGGPRQDALTGQVIGWR